MGSYYQPANYMKGGRRRRQTRKVKGHKGGFYPSVMGGVIGAGKVLMAASLRQGYKMLTSKNSSRSKKRSKKVRKH